MIVRAYEAALFKARQDLQLVERELQDLAKQKKQNDADRAGIACGIIRREGERDRLERLVNSLIVAAGAEEETEP